MAHKKNCWYKEYYFAYKLTNIFNSIWTHAACKFILRREIYDIILEIVLYVIYVFRFAKFEFSTSPNLEKTTTNCERLWFIAFYRFY